MLISITAPKKGLGQSVTAVNFTAILTQMINDKALLIDTNKYCKDISYYLSDSLFTKGLDDFKNLLDAEMLNDKLSFDSCVKHINKSIDMMDSNESFELSRDDIDKLISFTQRYYPITVVDTISGRNILSRYFFDKSDVIIVVLNQEHNSINRMVESKVFEPYKEKIVFVVNRYVESIRQTKIKYCISNILRDMKKGDFEPTTADNIFRLNYDPVFMNECNEKTILNYILNKANKEEDYVKQLEEVAEYVLTNYSEKTLSDTAITESKQKRKIFKFFSHTIGGLSDAKH